MGGVAFTLARQMLPGWLARSLSAIKMFLCRGWLRGLRSHTASKRFLAPRASAASLFRLIEYRLPAGAPCCQHGHPNTYRRTINSYNTSTPEKSGICIVVTK